MRPTQSITLILLVILSLLYAQITDIVVLDCKKTLHVLPNTMLAAHINITTAVRFYNGAMNALQNRLKCLCPGMDDNFFTNSFGANLQTGLFLTRPDKTLDMNMCNLMNYSMIRPPGFTPYSFKNQIGKTSISMPSTCTWESVLAGQPCGLSYLLPRSDVKFQLVVDSCPSENGVTNRVPFISLTCLGDNCKTIGMPCESTSTCGGGLSCINAGSLNYDQYLKDIGFFDASNCPTSETALSSYYWKQLMGMLIPSIWNRPDPTASYSSTSFCIPDLRPMPTNEWYTTSYVSDTTYVSVNGLTSWDRKLASGELANSDNRKNGVGFAAPSAGPAVSGNMVPVISFNCANELHILPSHPFAINSLFNISGSLQKFSDILNGIRSCKPEWTLEKHRGLVLLYQVYPWLKMLVKDLSFGTQFPNTLMMKLRLATAMPGALKMPSTCNYDTYANNGECSFSYTGLKDLLNADIKVHVSLRRCSTNPDGLPAFNIWCEGTACNVFNSLQFCSLNSDCGAGTFCIDIGSEIPDVYSGFIMDPKCKTSTDTLGDYKKVGQHMLGQTAVGGTDLRVCSFDFKPLLQNPQSIYTWAQSAATISGDQVTVSGLGAFSGVISCYGKLVSDAQVCSGNGVCSGIDNCACKTGFSGPQCETFTVFSCYGKLSTDAQVCSGNGVCNGTDSCACKAGFTGQQCATKSASSSKSSAMNWLLLACMLLLVRMMHE